PPLTAAADPTGPGGHSLPPLRPLLASLTMWGLCVASFGVSFGWYFYPYWQPKYLKDVFGISFAGSEVLAGLPFACGAVGCLFGGRLADTLGRRAGPPRGRGRRLHGGGAVRAGDRLRGGAVAGGAAAVPGLPDQRPGHPGHLGGVRGRRRQARRGGGGRHEHERRLRGGAVPGPDPGRP